jgi:hypothetical protein
MNIAPKTGEREIAQVVEAAMFLGDNVFDLKTEERFVLLPKAAVFG